MHTVHWLWVSVPLLSGWVYTALAFWIKGAEYRHRILIEANTLNGVKTIYGKFKKKISTCPLCKGKFDRHEEKYTDVNIALYAYKMALKGIGHFFVTGDTDLLPSIKLIKEDCPNVSLELYFHINDKTEKLQMRLAFITKQQFPCWRTVYCHMSYWNRIRKIYMPPRVAIPHLVRSVGYALISLLKPSRFSHCHVYMQSGGEDGRK